MLFITNRVLKQNSHTKTNRPIDFELRDRNALQSVFFCEREAADDYREIGGEAFMDRLKSSKAEQILIFIHGFNNLPENRIFPRAELLQQYFNAAQQNLVEVVPIVWPCTQTNGTREFIQGYYSDQMSADASAFAYARTLAKLQEWQLKNIANDEPCLKRINILAHSMGNRVLRGAVKLWSEDILGNSPPLLFRNIFMVAADVENETLEYNHEGQYIPTSARNVVVYHAYDDLAMRASKAGNATIRTVSRRMGHTGPYDMTKMPANVYSVNCDSVALPYDPGKGHTYFLDEAHNKAGEVFADILQCILTARVLPGILNQRVLP